MSDKAPIYLFDFEALKEELEEDEDKETRPYEDTYGNVSIGIGRNLTANGLSEQEIDLLFSNDVATAVASLTLRWPWWSTLPASQQRVMVNLCFNMGPVRFATFKRFLAAMQKQDWQAAATELMNSNWWHQVGSRGPRMIKRLMPPA